LPGETRAGRDLDRHRQAVTKSGEVVRQKPGARLPARQAFMAQRRLDARQHARVGQQEIDIGLLPAKIEAGKKGIDRFVGETGAGL
jgi:hypothetical protein